MAFGGAAGALFIGALTTSDKEFLKTLLVNARAKGYDRFIEPCAGALAMSFLAAESGFDPAKIEASDVSYFSGVFGRAVSEEPLDALEIKAEGFTAEELKDPATALYAQLYLRMASKAGRDYFLELLKDFKFRREEHVAEIQAQIDKDIFKQQSAEIERLATPAIDIEWKTVQFTFLSHQLKDLQKLCEKVQGVEVEGVADIALFKPFVEALEKTQKFDEVKAVGTAVYMMIKAALEKLGEAGYGDEDMEWVHLTKIFGGGAIPKEYADVISEAVKKMEKNGEINEKKKWEAIASWAARYLDENR